MAAKTKKSPERMCVGCRRLLPKDRLIRVVRTPGGEYRVDTGQKSAGRGAYLCRSEECFSSAKKHKSFPHSFKAAFDAAIYDALAKELTGGENHDGG